MAKSTKPAAKTALSVQIAEGDSISIVQACVLGSTGMHTASVAAEVAKVTDKAVQLQIETHTGEILTAWFPRRALNLIGDGAVLGKSNHQHFTTQFAPWLKLEGWNARFVEAATTMGFLPG